jgi:hypothetical protein
MRYCCGAVIGILGIAFIIQVVASLRRWRRVENTYYLLFMRTDTWIRLLELKSAAGASKGGWINIFKVAKQVNELVVQGLVEKRMTIPRATPGKGSGKKTEQEFRLTVEGAKLRREIVQNINKKGPTA